VSTLILNCALIERRLACPKSINQSSNPKYLIEKRTQNRSEMMKVDRQSKKMVTIAREDGSLGAITWEPRRTGGMDDREIPNRTRLNTFESAINIIAFLAQGANGLPTVG
jgi:hypothetical protein